MCSTPNHVTKGLDMTLSTLSRTDDQIAQSVRDELDWSADVHAVDLGVAVDHGTVALSGEVDDAFERRAALRATLRTIGVTSVVDELLLRASSAVWAITDTEIGHRAADAIRLQTTLPDSVRTSTEDHVVTLAGEVEWHYQRENARRAVESISGVTHVVNAITLRPRASAADADRRILGALVRNAMLDADAISVTVDGNTATLTGRVRSFAERTQAEHAAWSSPHVTDVRDYLTVTG